MNLQRPYPRMDGEPSQSGGQQIPQRDLAGYPDEVALVQGYRASSVEAKRQKMRADLLEQQLGNALQQQPQRPDIPQRDVWGRISEYGIPADDLRTAIASEIQAAFQPIARGIEARNTVLSEYKDYNQFESDVAQFVNQDLERQQRYQRMFREDPAGAMEWAFLKFGEQARKKTTPNPSNTNGVDPAALAGAQIPGSRAGDSRGLGIDQNLDALQKGWEHFQKTKDASQYAKARLKSVISDEFLNR